MTAGLFFEQNVGQPSATTALYQMRQQPGSLAYATKDKRIGRQEVNLMGDPWLRRFVDRLRSFRHLLSDWDSYGAQPPNEAAIERGEAILRMLHTMNFKPSSVTPSREEGITVVFHLKQRWASIECSNDGEIVAVTSDGTGNPTVWEVPVDDHSIRAALDRIRTFLS